MKRLNLTFEKQAFTVLTTFILLIVVSTRSQAQLAAGKSKFLGNIVASSVPANFSTYWNQVTPENSGKWGSVEGTRNQMNWSQLDIAYNFAKSKGYKFKQHNFVWGAQFPTWLTSLSQAQQKIEVEQWIQLYAQRYPNTDFVDVVNEPVKTPCPFKNALGGDGSTGWDWVIWAFQKARQYLPNAKLLINEYGTENDANARNQYINIINLLKSRGLIDGIGVQAHYFNLDNMTASQMTTCLNAYQATGVDVYISELDITGGGSEAGQSAKYQELFPVMWNHPSVKGITLWGYTEGQTWHSGTGILNSNGTERQAMTWLKSFMSGGGTSRTVTIRARGTNGSERIELRVNNSVVTSWTLTTTMQNYIATAGTGTIRVQFTNDASGRDVQVDYIKTGNTTFQSESQSVNTGVFQNGHCGGSNSEWLHCNGYIEYAGSSNSTRTVAINTAENTSPVEKINIYPNPAVGGNFIVELTNAKSVISILDMNGRMIKFIPSNGRRTLNVQSGLRSGAYMIRIQDGKETIIKKLLVQ